MSKDKEKAYEPLPLETVSDSPDLSSFLAFAFGLALIALAIALTIMWAM